MTKSINFVHKSQEEIEKKNLHLLREQEAARKEAARVREIYHEKKMRQQVRENNQELRELESKLRQAYVSKALAAQKKEREAVILAEKIQDKHEGEVLEKARLNHLEDMKKEQEIERERKKKLHEDLTEQIVTAHKQHQKLYEEFLREKYYLDEIAQRVKEELLELAQKKVERRERTKKEMDAFKVIKKELERIKEIETNEENQRIVEYCQKRDKKIEEDEKRQRELEKNRENLNEKMVAELSELSVSLETFYFVSECHEKSVDVLAVGEALAKALEHHRIFQHGFEVVVKRDNSILVMVHFLDDDVDKIFYRFVDVFVLMLVHELPQQVHHLFTANFVFARNVVDLKAERDLFFQ